jgi:hypothetical protein
MELNKMKKKFLSKSKIFTILLFLIGITTTNSFAQDMAVPANLQAALFKKIFAFDKTIQAKGSTDVVILSADGSADEIASAFKSVGINAKVVKGSQVPGEVNIVYIMPGVASPKGQCAQKKVLSISGVASYAESGKVSIALDVEGGKPKIVVNIAQLKAEGQELSSDLLKIAKVIQ